MDPIDLTLTISEKLPSFPGSPHPHFIPWSKLRTDGYNLEMIFLSTHSGTHIDAPFHFIQKGCKIHEIPIFRLCVKAILIKLHNIKKKFIGKNDIINFEKEFGVLENFSTVIFSTGWQKNLQKSQFFTNNPGLSKSAAKYLVSKKVNMVGIDSPSIDVGKDHNFPVHHIFAKNNVLILENLCNLEKISDNFFKLIVLPLKLHGTTGSPVRAIAI